MPYAGHTLMMREVAALAQLANASNGTFPFLNRKVEVCAVCWAESRGSVGAWHDNPGSRDCGIMQINIPSSQIGSSKEFALRSENRDDPDVWHQIALNNLRAAADLFVEVGPNGHKRQWGPWVSWTEGWAPYPEAWVWSRVLPDTWVQTSRALHRAIRGVVNDHWVRGHLSLDGAAKEGERLADIYGITKGDLFYDTSRKDLGVQWHYPPMPKEPGSMADYPKKNNGHSIILPL